jgi:hypothetical protein
VAASVCSPTESHSVRKSISTFLALCCPETRVNRTRTHSPVIVKLTHTRTQCTAPCARRGTMGLPGTRQHLSHTHCALRALSTILRLMHARACLQVRARGARVLRREPHERVWVKRPSTHAQLDPRPRGGGCPPHTPRNDCATEASTAHDMHTGPHLMEVWVQEIDARVRSHWRQ